MQIQNLCHKKLLKISKYIPRTNQNKQTKKRKAKQKQKHVKDLLRWNIHMNDDTIRHETDGPLVSCCLWSLKKHFLTSETVKLNPGQLKSSSSLALTTATAAYTGLSDGNFKKDSGEDVGGDHHRKHKRETQGYHSGNISLMSCNIVIHTLQHYGASPLSHKQPRVHNYSTLPLLVVYTYTVTASNW